MEFKILAVGDVVGNPGMERIHRSLRYWKQKCSADFVVVNGENASVVGMTPNQAEDIFDAGADVITMGNHTFGKKELCDYLDENSRYTGIGQAYGADISAGATMSYNAIRDAIDAVEAAFLAQGGAQ